jgi:hypothetical protein
MRWWSWLLLIVSALLAVGLIALMITWRRRFVAPPAPPFQGRVAVCLSGLLREPRCVESLYEHVVRPLGADVFLALDASATPQQRAHMEALLRPRAAIYETLQTQATETSAHVDVLWQRVARCDALRRQREQQLGVSYDVVLRVRPEMLFYGPLPSGWLWRAARDEREIIVQVAPDTIALGCTDQFTLAGPRSMALLAALPQHWEDLMPPQGQMIRAEHLVERYCQRVGLFPCFAALPMRFIKYTASGVIRREILRTARLREQANGTAKRTERNRAPINNFPLFLRRLACGNKRSCFDHYSV